MEGESPPLIGKVDPVSCVAILHSYSERMNKTILKEACKIVVPYKIMGTQVSVQSFASTTTAWERAMQHNQRTAPMISKWATASNVPLIHERVLKSIFKAACKETQFVLDCGAAHLRATTEHRTDIWWQKWCAGATAWQRQRLGISTTDLHSIKWLGSIHLCRSGAAPGGTTALLAIVW